MVEKGEFNRIWQMLLALLDSNGQLRTERYGNTEKGCQQKTTDDEFFVAEY